MSHPVDVPEAWPEGTVLDGAMDAAFYDAVRRHREANVPMAMWEDGEVRHVSPFDIPLPGEDLPTPVLSSGPGSQARRRRVQGGD